MTFPQLFAPAYCWIFCACLFFTIPRSPWVRLAAKWLWGRGQAALAGPPAAMPGSKPVRFVRARADRRYAASGGDLRVSGDG